TEPPQCRPAGPAPEGCRSRGAGQRSSDVTGASVTVGAAVWVNGSGVPHAGSGWVGGGAYTRCVWTGYGSRRCLEPMASTSATTQPIIVQPSRMLTMIAAVMVTGLRTSATIVGIR